MDLKAALPLSNLESQSRSHKRKLATLLLTTAVVAFVGIGITIEVVFLPKASSRGSQTATPSEPVKTTFNQWVADLGSRNVTGLGDSYAQNATVTWTGQAGGLTGTYDGQFNIRILYGSTLGKFTSINANIVDYGQNDINASVADISFNLSMTGNSSVFGETSILVYASQEWGYAGGRWQVESDTWNYITFVQQFSGTHTTFPQWSAIIRGQNPNLVSEKSLEWHVGPYMAASLYAFLGGVVAMGFMMYWKRSQRWPFGIAPSIRHGGVGLATLWREASLITLVVFLLGPTSTVSLVVILSPFLDLVTPKRCASASRIRAILNLEPQGTE
jgi:hypothetical protein